MSASFCSTSSHSGACSGPGAPSFGAKPSNTWLSKSSRRRRRRAPRLRRSARAAWRCEQLYQRAIELDPNFALAIARYSELESWIVHTFDPTAARREKARTLAERALQLQPDLPEAHLARGVSYYYGDNNYDAALKEFEIAQRGLPNESEIYLYIGAIQRRQGKWAESTANLEKAVSLNPKDAWPLQNLSLNYQMLRNFAKANEAIDRAIALDPTAFEPLEVKSKLALFEKGDFSVAEKAFEALKSAPMTNEQRLNAANARANVFLLERKYREGLQEAENLPDDQVAAFPGHLWSKYYYIGFARKALQDEAGARAAFLKAKSVIEEQLKGRPGSEDLHIQLARVLAYLGEKASAQAEAQRATELLPESKDAFGWSRNYDWGGRSLRGSRRERSRDCDSGWIA